jgi:hypothetical protein
MRCMAVVLVMFELRRVQFIRFSLCSAHPSRIQSGQIDFTFDNLEKYLVVLPRRFLRLVFEKDGNTLANIHDG